MLGSAVRPVKASFLARWVACVALGLLAGGCYWLRYERVLSVHLEVLTSYATKLGGLAQDGTRIPAQRWGEFTYPLERARDFSLSVERWAAPLPSFQAFQVVLERYDALVQSPAILESPGAAADIQARVEGLRQAVAATRDAMLRDP
jgi:hypothetical protein